MRDPAASQPAAARRAFWNDVSLAKKTLLSVHIPLLALVAAFVIFRLMARTAEEAEASVAHSRAVRHNIAALQSGVLEAEDAARGFLLLDDPGFLATAEAELQVLPRRLQAVEDLVRDDAAQRERCASLRSAVERRMEIIRNVIAAGQSDAGPEEIRSLVEQGRDAMKEVRAHIRVIDAEEQSLEDQRVRRAEETRARGDSAVAWSLILGGAGGIGAVLLLSGSIVRRLGLVEQSARLLARGEPLVPVDIGRDEIGQVEQELETASKLLADRTAALEASKRELEAAVAANQLIMDNSRDVICTIDAEGRFIRCSAAAKAVWGYEPSELVGRFYIDLVKPEDRERTNAAAASIIGGSSVTDFENCYRRADGSHVDMMWSAHWSPDQQCMFCVARDVTDRARADRELRRSSEAIDRASRAKSEFLSRMSHELRTPLNAIIGFAQLLDLDATSDRERERIGLVLRAGHHLLELINEVLDLSRIEAGRFSISPEAVSLRHVMEECVALIRPAAQQRDIAIKLVDGGACDVHVRADRQRLLQILLNLLSNAVKYNHDHGAVSVDCVATDEHIRINVRDTGPGIREEDTVRLFTPFERLGADRGNVEGSGLGLALSKRLVELMEGEIGVETGLGTGSTFWVRLPAAADPAAAHTTPAAPAAPAEPPAAAMPDGTLLYIEDNLSNLRLIEQIIGLRPALQLISAMQGTLGIELAREHRPALILLDLNLPDLPGHEVLARLRSDPLTREIPVIVISADATQGQIERLMRAGARSYLTKPINVSGFLAAIDSIISERVEVLT
jgi:PAS domain S-box-containing protein